MRVVSIVRDAEWQRHIRIALGPLPIIRWVLDDAELDTISGLGSANVVVWHIEAHPDLTHQMPARLRRVRTAMLSSPIVLYCCVAPGVARLIQTVGHLGVDVALRGYDDLANVLADTIHARRYGNACEEILARIAPGDDRVALVMAQCVRRAFDSVLTVEALARELGVDRKTLHNRLRSAGFPSPAALISWSRLLVAGWLLDDPRRTVGEVARVLRFASASDLRGMFARYVQARATDLRLRGALRAVAQAFDDACVRHTPVGRDASSRSHPDAVPGAGLPIERRVFPNQRLGT
jgi:AraC-like DNA-binding protein